jgi:hypothetical protein
LQKVEETVVTNLEAQQVMVDQVAVLQDPNHLMLVVAVVHQLNHNNQVYQDLAVLEMQVETLVVVHYLTLPVAVVVLELQDRMLVLVVVTTVLVTAAQVKMYHPYLVLHNLGTYQVAKQDSLAAEAVVEDIHHIPLVQEVVADQVAVVMEIVAMVLHLVHLQLLVVVAEEVQTL